jgi:lipopolysaccharide transport system permease protein
MTRAAALFSTRQFIYTRDLLHQLVSREMKIRYKRSVLGIAWSLITPLLQLVVFTFLFRKVVQINVPNYPLFVFIGVLTWGWFSSSLTLATGAITDNRELVKRPGFPAAILPAVTVTTQLVHFLLVLPILFCFVIFGGGQVTAALLVLPFIIVIQFLLTTSLAYLLAAVHVTFHDTRHIVGVMLLLLFYLTPVFYDAKAVPARYWSLYRLNPMMHLIDAYRAILIWGKEPDGLVLVGIGIVASGLLWLGYSIFTRASYRFVEEL